MRSRTPALLLLGLSLSATPARADTYPRQPGVDVAHYTFRLTLADDSDEIAGESTADLRFTREGVKEVVLDLASAANGKGMTVADVTCDGKAVKFTHEKGKLRIALDPVSKAGERRAFTVKYAGVPAAGLLIGPNKHKDRTFFSNNWPDKAREWLPVIDHPYDKATSEFVVTAPSKYQVVSNGLLQEETDLRDGRRRTHWKQSVPIATWLNALGVAQFAVHHAGTVRGVPLQTWVFPQDKEAGIPALEEPARKAIEFYTDTVGPFPYEKLANVQAVGFTGGMELASSIFYGPDNISTLGTPALVAHEVAHQWFGNAVTEADWDDVWLSEGFATYFALLYCEHYDGRDSFVRRLKASRDKVFDAEKKFPGYAVIHDNLADMRDIFKAPVYQKGAWALHMLRRQVGSEQFFDGLRAYYKKHRDSNASTDELRAAMEEQCGQKLDWFFKQWLRRAGSPEVSGGWKYDAEAKKVVIDLAQIQSGDPYRLPLEIGLTLKEGEAPKVVKVELTKAKETFELEAATAPTEVTLDPNTWALIRAKFDKR